MLQLDVPVKPEDIETLFYTLDLSDEEKGVDIVEFHRAFQVSFDVYFLFSYCNLSELYFRLRAVPEPRFFRLRAVPEPRFS